MGRTSRLKPAERARLSKIAQKRKQIPTNQQLAKELNCSVRLIEYYMTKYMRKPARIGKGINQSVGMINPMMWRRLMQLCHPDRHGNSQASTEVTQWLMEIRKTVN